MTKAILINPENRTVTEVDITETNDDGVESIQKHLKTNFFESAPALYPGTVSLVVDLFSEDMEGKVHKGKFQVSEKIIGFVTGRMLVVSQEEGEAIDSICSVGDIESQIEWIPETP